VWLWVGDRSPQVDLGRERFQISARRIIVGMEHMRL
jgi:hypothetical protein